MRAPFMSICIPTYNRAKYVGEAIQSVLSQTFQDYEIIVIDNCSDDHTKEVIDSLQDSRIRFIRNDWNIGSNKNINRSMAESSGKYMKILHSDDILVEADALQQMVEAALRYPQAGIITCGYRFASKDFEHCLPFELLRPKGFNTVREVMDIHNFGLPSEWLLRRDVLPYVGCFAETPVSDVDLAMKMVYYFDSFAIPTVLIEHRFIDENETAIASRMNSWGFMRFQELPRLPYAAEISNEMKVILSAYLHTILMNVIRKSIANENYHIALQGVLDLLKTDPYLPYFPGEDREKALQCLLQQLVFRKSPAEIADFMAEQRYSKPYADIFAYGFGFNYQLYRLEEKLIKTKKKLCIVGNGPLTGLFLQNFPQLKEHVIHIIDPVHNGSEAGSVDGIQVISNTKISINDTFTIFSTAEHMRMQRYESIQAGLTEGVHFLPLLEI